MGIELFLRGGTRPNPPPAPAWRLWRRGADAPRGAPWAPWGSAPSRADALAEILTPARPHRPYDVLRLAAPGRASHWFVGDDGEARRLPALPRMVELIGVRTGGPSGRVATWGNDWVGAWESLHRGDALLIIARAAGMPPAALARVACALARRVLPLARRMPNGTADGRPEAALAAVEAALAPGADPRAADRARSLAQACEAVGTADYARGYRYRPGYHVAKAIRYAADAADGVEADGGRSSAGFAASSAAAAKNAEAWARGPVGSELQRATEAEDAERRAQAEVVRAAFPLPALLLRATTGAE